MLAESPTRITELTTGLTTEELHAPACSGDWSPRDVLAHLRACADVWGECIIIILDSDAATIRAVNPRTWIKKTDYRQQNFEVLLEAFEVQRTALLDVLKPLSPEDWLCSATVTGAGAQLERTVQYYANWMAIHEGTHWKQLKKISKAVRS